MQRNTLMDMFNSVVRQENSARDDSYLNAPVYYALTGRRQAWLHEGYGASLVVCRHPHIDRRLLVFPEIGAAEGRLTASVLTALDERENDIQLARYSDHDLRQLRSLLLALPGQRVTAINECAETSLDWRYPVHILDMARVAGMAGGPFVSIRNKFRKVADDIEMLPFSHPDALKTMRAAYRFWQGSMILRGQLDHNDSDYYPTLFAMIERWPDRLDGNIYLHGKRPAGFTVFDQPFAGTSNLLANLSDATISGLADYQIVTTCRTLQDKGVHYLISADRKRKASICSSANSFRPKA